MDANDISDGIKRAYGSMQSYEDSGIIKSNNFNRGDGWFKTEFMRPNLLRFQWCTSQFDEDRRILLVKGDKARLSLPKSAAHLPEAFKVGPDLEAITSVHMAFSMAGGTSFGITDTIMPLLVDKTDRPNFTRHKIARLKDDIQGGKRCFRIREVFQSLNLWVSQDDFTIRRVQSDGCAIFNEFMNGYTSAVFNLVGCLFPHAKHFPEDGLSSLSRPLDSDWILKDVRFNHLAENHFDEFDLEAETSAGVA